MPSRICTSEWISALRNPICLSSTAPRLAHHCRFLASFQIHPSSLSNQIYSHTSLSNNRRHKTLTDRWNALSSNRSCRPFSQSPTIGTQNVPTATLINEKLPRQNSHSDNAYHGRFREFDLAGKVYIVTGGAQGLGLSLAEALLEAGGTGLSCTLQPSHHQLTQSSALVHCLDRQDTPDAEFEAIRLRANPDYGGSLHYTRMYISKSLLLLPQDSSKKH